MLDEKDLQAIAQLLAQQKGEIIGELRQEMDEQINGLRQEMGEQIGGLRQEMGEQIGGLRQEMDVQIGGLRQEMDTRFNGLRQEMDARFTQQKSEIMHEVNLLMEGYFDPKFNALADGLELLREKLVGREEIEEESDRLDVVEAVIKVHSREIEKLKRANNIA